MVHYQEIKKKTKAFCEIRKLLVYDLGHISYLNMTVLLVAIKATSYLA